MDWESQEQEWLHGLLALLAFIGGQIILYQDYFGFPMVGAVLTAVSTGLYIWWQWYQLEPQKA